MPEHQSAWFYAIAIFAPIVAFGAYVIYLLSERFVGKLVGSSKYGEIQQHTVEGMVVGVYALVVAVVLNGYFGREIMLVCFSAVCVVMGFNAGFWRGRRQLWAWRTAGFIAVFVAAELAEILH